LKATLGRVRTYPAPAYGRASGIRKGIESPYPLTSSFFLFISLESGKELKEFAGFSLYSAYKTSGIRKGIERYLYLCIHGAPLPPLESGKELKDAGFLQLDAGEVVWNPERN